MLYAAHSKLQSRAFFFLSFFFSFFFRKLSAILIVRQNDKAVMVEANAASVRPITDSSVWIGLSRFCCASEG